MLKLFHKLAPLFCVVVITYSIWFTFRLVIEIAIAMLGAR